MESSSLANMTGSDLIPQLNTINIQLLTLVDSQDFIPSSPLTTKCSERNQYNISFTFIHCYELPTHIKTIYKSLVVFVVSKDYFHGVDG